MAKVASGNTQHASTPKKFQLASMYFAIEQEIPHKNALYLLACGDFKGWRRVTTNLEPEIQSAGPGISFLQRVSTLAFLANVL